MRFLAGIWLLLCISAAATESPAVVAAQDERAAVLALHHKSREAHFRGDVEAILEGAAPEVVNVTQGRIHRVARQQTRQFLTNYLQGATYLEWDDLEPPVVRVSRDGTMAWLAVRVHSRRTKRTPQGIENEESFVFSGLMALEKHDGKWVRVASATTLE